MNTTSAPSTSNALLQSHQYAASASNQATNMQNHVQRSDPYGTANLAQSNYSSYAVGSTPMMTDMDTTASHTFEMSPPIVPSQNLHQTHNHNHSYNHSQGGVLAGLPLDPMYSSTTAQALSSLDNAGHPVLNYGIPGTGTHYETQPAEPMAYHSPTFAPFLDPTMGVTKFNAVGDGVTGVDRQDDHRTWSNFVQQLGM